MNTLAFLRPWHVRLLACALLVAVTRALIVGTRTATESPATPFAVLLMVGVAGWLLIQFLFWLARQAAVGDSNPLATVRMRAIPVAKEAVDRYLPVLLMAPFFSGFAALKGLVPKFGGWRLDPALAAFDRVLFFGHTPWRVLHQALGSGIGPFIDIAYGFWLLAQMGTLFLVAAFGSERLRAQFFQSWVLVWLLLGCVAAIALASAGPIFAVEFQLPGNAEFAGLVEGLRDARGALRAREMLLTAYYQNVSQVGSGISAAPSLHVATTTLLFLTARAVHPVLAWLAAAFLAVIVVGSVYLGWHYVADGILGAVGAVVIWRLVARITPAAADAQHP